MRMKGAILAAAVVLVLFFGLGWAMTAGLTDGLDRGVILAFRSPHDLATPLGGDGALQLFRGITALGGTIVVVGIGIAAAGVLVRLGRRRESVALVGSVAIALVLSALAKALYGRPRPDLVPHDVHVTSASFPSGHAAHAAALYVMLAILAAGLTPRPGSRALVFGAGAGLVGAIGLSRVYLGVHYPSDVLAGWALGTFCALVSWMALQTAKRRKR